MNEGPKENKPTEKTATEPSLIELSNKLDQLDIRMQQSLDQLTNQMQQNFVSIRLDFSSQISQIQTQINNLMVRDPQNHMARYFDTSMHTRGNSATEPDYLPYREANLHKYK
jgi:hypothetical protein